MEKKTRQFYEEIENAIIDYNNVVDSGIADRETRSGQLGKSAEIYWKLKHIRNTEKVLEGIKKQKERKEARKMYNKVNGAFTIYTLTQYTIAILYKIFRRR